MLKTGAVERYARALFEVAVEENQLDRFIEELNAIKEILHANPELGKFLHDPRIQDTAKKDLIGRLLGTQVSPLIVNFVNITIDKDRATLLPAIIDYFQDLARNAKNIIKVRVETAFALDNVRRGKLIDRLEELTGKNIELEEHVIPALIGGMLIRIGDTIIDGTMKHHLERIRENLAQVQVS